MKTITIKAGKSFEGQSISLINSSGEDQDYYYWIDEDGEHLKPLSELPASEGLPDSFGNPELLEGIGRR